MIRMMQPMLKFIIKIEEDTDLTNADKIEVLKLLNESFSFSDNEKIILKSVSENFAKIIKKENNNHG